VFLDRSIMYLATGKPVLLQDTGFSELLPCGAGLFAWRTIDDIAAAVETINRDYATHCRAARRVAAEQFDSDRVLGALLRECDLPVTA
jgi:glycosyltransferase involved in cell wall biosynthesis